MLPSSNLAESLAPVASSEAEARYALRRLWDAGRRGDAIARLDTALRLNPESPDALGMGGYMLGEMGKPEAALRFYGRALALDPRLALAYSNAGKLLVGLGRPAEALEAFEAATALKPADADAWNGRAGALRELGGWKNRSPPRAGRSRSSPISRKARSTSATRS